MTPQSEAPELEAPDLEAPDLVAPDLEAPDLEAPGPAAAADEAALLARLAAAVREGQVKLTIDRRKLSHMDFPLALEADGNRWAYALCAGAAATFWYAGPIAGLVAAAVGVTAYQTLGRADMTRRLDRRIRERGLASVEIWRRLWRFGGVILTRDDMEPCQGPAGSWMALARALDA